MDFNSVFLSTIGFSGILYGFSAAGNEGWSSTVVNSFSNCGRYCPWTVYLAVSANPFIELRTFKYGMFTLTNIINIGITIIGVVDLPDGEQLEMMKAIMKHMPMRTFVDFSQGAFTEEMMLPVFINVMFAFFAKKNKYIQIFKNILKS